MASNQCIKYPGMKGGGKKWRIPPDAGLIRDPRDPKMDRLRVSYTFYTDSVFEVRDLQPSAARKCLQSLRLVASLTRRTIWDSNTGIGKKRVLPANQYSSVQCAVLKAHSRRGPKRALSF